MPLTLQVLDGADRGKLYRELSTPVTIGREEGNSVQLNDERISRFHAKIQEDQGQLVLTDLDSTNGTRVNGEIVQLSILRIGDRITVGRSLLLMGSPEEIGRRWIRERPPPMSGESEQPVEDLDRTCALDPSAPAGEVPSSGELHFELHLDGNQDQPERPDQSNAGIGLPEHPRLPEELSPAQAARLSELLLYLHHRLVRATEKVAPGDEKHVRLGEEAWQRILQVEMDLARFVYLIGHPEERDQD